MFLFKPIIKMFLPTKITRDRMNDIYASIHCYVNTRDPTPEHRLATSSPERKNQPLERSVVRGLKLMQEIDKKYIMNIENSLLNDQLREALVLAAVDDETTSNASNRSTWNVNTSALEDLYNTTFSDNTINIGRMMSATHFTRAYIEVMHQGDKVSGIIATNILKRIIRDRMIAGDFGDPEEEYPFISAEEVEGTLV